MSSSSMAFFNLPLGRYSAGEVTGWSIWEFKLSLLLLGKMRSSSGQHVRNKYPEMYRQIEEKQVHNKEPSSAGSVAPSHPPLPTRQAPHRRDNVLEPSVSNMMNENNSLMTLEPHLHRRGSREDLMMPKWAGPSASASMGNMGGGFHELPGMESFSRETLDGEVGGMMDISRLLLDG